MFGVTKRLLALLVMALPTLVACGGDAVEPPDPTVNREDSNKLTQLMRASARGDVTAVNALLRKGADPNIASSEQKVTALMFASYSGHTEVVNALLGRGANVDAKDSGNNGAIDWAAVGGHEDIAKLFAGRGAKLNPAGGGFLGVGSMPLWFMKKAAEKVP